MLLRSGSPPPGAVVVQTNYRDNPRGFPTCSGRNGVRPAARPDKYQRVWLGEVRARNSEARVFKIGRSKVRFTARSIFRLGADWDSRSIVVASMRCYIDGIDVDHEAYMIGCGS